MTRALVIEDDPDVARLIGLELNRLGYETEAALSGEAGLAAAHGERPDLILLDLRMEPVDGFEVLRRLQEDDTTADIPVLVVSIVEAEQRARTAGARGFVGKPFDVATLRRALLDLTS